MRRQAESAGASWVFQDGRDTLLSSCGNYRYASCEALSDSPKACCFIMLNPAGVKRDKPGATRRNCIKFARANGCGTLLTCNLFALSAKSPRELRRASDPVGPENDRRITETVRRASGEEDMIVCAWGARDGAVVERARRVVAILAAEDTAGRLYALRLNDDGRPQHPGARVSQPLRGVPLRILNGGLTDVREVPKENHQADY